MSKKQIYIFKTCAFLFMVYACLCGYVGYTSDIYFWKCLLALSTFVVSLISIICWDISTRNPAQSHTWKTLLIQYMFYTMFTFFGKIYLLKLRHFTKNVKRHQEKVLLEIVHNNKQSEYGRLHKFEEITTKESFIQKTKLCKYEDIKGYVARMEKGETNILLSDEVLYFATSSGTTGSNKSIPITNKMKMLGMKKMMPIIVYFTTRGVRSFLQRGFILSYASKTVQTPCGLRKGPVTQFMTKISPFDFCPPEVYQLPDEKIYMHLQAIFALQEPEIGRIDCTMATVVYSFWKYLDVNWKIVVQDIEQGTLSVNSSEEHIHELLLNIKRHLKPNKTRAYFLNKEFESGFHNIARRIWPNLRAARMLTTGGFAHHAKILKEVQMPNVTQFSFLHVASEGLMGIDISGDPEAGTYMAMIDYGFLEFIPERDIEEEQPKTLFAEQVEIGQTYEVVITSPIGLYRYRTGDMVEIVSYYNQCPVYKFAYRTGQLLNVFWEKLPENVFYESVTECQQELGNLEISEYTSTEDINVRNIVPGIETKCYVVFVELARPAQSYRLTDADKHKFDEHLRRKFELYNTLRDSNSIGPMRIIQVKAGTFALLKSKVNAVWQSQQYKVPRVLRNTDHLQLLWENRLEDK